MGMNFWTPQTGKMGDGWRYTYDATRIKGFKQTHQPSPLYVFSAIGFYPVAPATNQYVVGAPLFKKVTLQLENGNAIQINATDNTTDNHYIGSLRYNDAPYTKNWLSHSGIMKGGTLDFNMIAEPNIKRGIQPSDFPYSLSTAE